MTPDSLTVLAALCEAQRQYEAADHRRDELVRAARSAGATWDQVAYATRTTLSTAHSRWSKRLRTYGKPRAVPLEVPAFTWPAALRSVAS